MSEGCQRGGGEKGGVRGGGGDEKGVIVHEVIQTVMIWRLPFVHIHVHLYQRGMCYCKKRCGLT